MLDRRGATRHAERVQGLPFNKHGSRGAPRPLPAESFVQLAWRSRRPGRCTREGARSCEGEDVGAPRASAQSRALLQREHRGALRRRDADGKHGLEDGGAGNKGSGDGAVNRTA